jgi:excinuclease ABC subunit C
MDHDSTDHPKAARKRRGSQPDLPPQDHASADVDPATSAPDEEDEPRLPEAAEEPAEAVAEGPLAAGHAAIENAVRLAPTSPGVYRMLNEGNDVLYVGKAKNVRKRLASYARVNAPLPARILRMIAATVAVEIVTDVAPVGGALLPPELAVVLLAHAVRRISVATEKVRIERAPPLEIFAMGFLLGPQASLHERDHGRSSPASSLE